MYCLAKAEVSQRTPRPPLTAVIDCFQETMATKAHDVALGLSATKSVVDWSRRHPLFTIKNHVWLATRGIAFIASKLMKYSNRHGYYCGALYNRTYWQGCRISAKLAETSEDRLGGAFESAGSVFL